MRASRKFSTGKVIEFEGTMPAGFKGELDEDIPIAMERQTLTIPTKLFSPANGDGTVTGAVDTLHLRFESSAVDAWTAYVAAVLTLYLDLPDTPLRPSPLDQSLARQLDKQSVPLPLVESALLLATLRRFSRPSDLVWSENWIRGRSDRVF
jgi:hypothetical protein